MSAATPAAHASMAQDPRCQGERKSSGRQRKAPRLRGCRLPDFLEREGADRGVCREVERVAELTEQSGTVPRRFGVKGQGVVNRQPGTERDNSKIERDDLRWYRDSTRV